MAKARFILPTPRGRVSFEVEIPDEKYDGMAILELFQKHYPPEEGAPPPRSPVSDLLAQLKAKQRKGRRKA